MRSLETTTSDEQVSLDEILNTADPKIKHYFAQVYYQEMEEAEKRAVYRVAAKFKHMLPDSKQILVAEALRSMAAPVTLTM